MSIRKSFKITERVNFEFQTVIVNVLNHPVFFDPTGGTISTRALVRVASARCQVRAIRHAPWNLG